MQIDEKFHTLRGGSLIIGWMILILIILLIILAWLWLEGDKRMLVVDVMKITDPEQRVRVIDENAYMIYAGKLNEADEEILMRIVDRIVPINDKLYLHTS